MARQKLQLPLERQVIEFKVDSIGLWEALRDGRKTWDARWAGQDDPRIKLLFHHGHLRAPLYVRFLFFPDPADAVWIGSTPTLLFRVLGHRSAPWAKGWVFIRLGERTQETEPFHG